MLRSLALSALFVAFASAHADPIKRANQPAVSPDGATVVFSWQGDLWSVAAAGGRAQRLTIHPAVDRAPKFTPDGKKIVFTSDRFGSTDVFVMDADGTNLKRLTFASDTEIPTAISPDGKTVIGYTSAYSAGRPDLFRVPLEGGEMVRITDHPYEQEYHATFTPDGSRIVYNRGSYGPTAWQKPGVRSSALPDIWIADNTVPLTNHRPLLRTEATELSPLIAKDGAIYYVSNAGGWPNIWRSTVGGGPGKAITAHKDGTVRNPALSIDGKTLVYEFESELYVLDTATGKTRLLAIDVPSDQRLNPVTDLSLATGVGEFALSPDGKRTVIGVRGELFLIPEKGGTTRRLTTNVAVDEQPVWLDAKTILYVRSDKGKRDLYTVDLDGASKPFLTDGQDLTHPILSPDRKQVAFHRGGEEICLVPATGGTLKTLIKGNFVNSLRGSEAFSWSPDGKWLVVSKLVERHTSVILLEVETGKQIVAARAAQSVDGAKFLANGRGIYFVADEYNGEADLFVVDLVPAAPEFTEDDLDKIDEKKDEAKKPVVVEVVPEGIELRMRRLTASGGVSEALASPDSKTIWANVSGQLTAIPVAGGAAQPVAAVTGSASNLKLGSTGTKLYFTSAGRLLGYTLGAPAAAPIAFNAQMSVNLRDEEQALFDEIWWSMDRFYYDTTFHGKDWKAIKAKFAQIVPFVYDRTDFYALMGEMMEELDSSHLGATAPPPPVSPGFGDDSTAYLGVEFDPKAIHSSKAYVVTKVYANTSGANPASLLKVGDRLKTIDGVAVGSQPIAQLLNKKARTKVKLGVERDGQLLTILIRPDSSAIRSGIVYEDFVAWQRAQTEKLSGGKLAYTHIRSMDDPSFFRFLREIRTQTAAKTGMLLDVRFNGGGSTAHKVLGVMVKAPWLIRTTRGPEGLRLSENIFRGDSLEIPSALLFNTYSYSNAEIIGEGFRQLKLGPLVGERTPGYVIGTGGVGLWDGGFIRMPSIGAYAVNGENLENNGRRPDFTVWFDPNAWAQGRDLQLEKAVQELLKTAK